MDIGTGLSILGSAKLLEKLLGPTAEYIGTGVKTWTENRVANVSRIFDIAAKSSAGSSMKVGQYRQEFYAGF